MLAVLAREPINDPTLRQIVRHLMPTVPSIPKRKKPKSISPLHGFPERVNAVTYRASIRYRLRIVNQHGRAGAPERNSTVEKQKAVIHVWITASVNGESDGAFLELLIQLGRCFWRSSGRGVSQPRPMR